MATNSDNVYFSLTMRNTTNVHQPSVYTANLNSAVIKNPSLYELSVDRSLINTGGLAVYRFLQNTDPASDYPSEPLTAFQFKSNLVVACRFNGNVVHRNLIFDAPNRLTQGVLANGIKYGDVFTFQDFVRIYNEAMSACIAELKTSFGLNIACPVPLLLFSGDSDKFSLFLADYSTYFVQTLPDASRVDVLNDIILGNLLKGFDFIREQTTHAEYRYRTLPNASTDVTLVQDYSALSAFSPVANVYIRTTLHVTNQFEKDERTGVLTQSAILRDYTLFLDDETSSLANSYVFNVVTEREFMTIEQTSPLFAITVQAFWRDIFGFDYEIYLPPFSSSNVKLYFRKRDQYRYTTTL